MKSVMRPSVRTSVIAALGLGLWMLAESSSAACLQKAGPVFGKASTYVFMLAPESAVAGYVSLGFSRIDCPSDLSLFRTYVAQICGGNGGGPQPPLNTDIAIGVPRAQACKDAKAGLAEAGG
jgi:hypothetical protein